MTILYVGIDLAKSVFAVHGVNEAGKPALVAPRVARAKLLEMIASLPPCVIAMEACSGGHHWARQFMEHGHTVRLIAPKFVTPYRMSGKGGKNDAADAAAICEAVQRPNMRFVPVKTLRQQSELSVHRVRQGFIQQRTATLNRIRGLLSEFGFVLPLRAATVRSQARACLEDLPGWSNTVIGNLLSEVARLDKRIELYDHHIAQIAREDARAQQLMRLKGVGPTTATALVATIGNGHEFKCGRQFSAWVGLVPSQHSSGGKARLGHITKAGDSYIRSLLILGARTVLNGAANKTDSISQWAKALVERRGYWRAAPSQPKTLAWLGRCSREGIGSRCQREPDVNFSGIFRTDFSNRRLTACSDEARLDLRGVYPRRIEHRAAMDAPDAVLVGHPMRDLGASLGDESA